MTQESPPGEERGATVVVQRRIAPEHDHDFGRWTLRLQDAVAEFAGFQDYEIIPPKLPAQPDWVIVQHFASADAARAWLASDVRKALVKEVEPWEVDPEDVHIFVDDARQPASVSAVVSIAVTPGHEAEFRAWQERIMEVVAQSPGYQGARLDPPVPGLHDDWLVILRFDSNDDLNRWLQSPQRAALHKEAAGFTQDVHVRKAMGGFGGWFSFSGPGGVPTPTWKQSMIVLLALYPISFLFGHFVQIPYLLDRGVPFWIAIFVSNAFGVGMLGFLVVPQLNRLFRWWLHPDLSAPRWVAPAGAISILLLYLVLMALFSRLP